MSYKFQLMISQKTWPDDFGNNGDHSENSSTSGKEDTSLLPPVSHSSV